MKIAYAVLAASLASGAAYAGGYTPAVTEPAPVAVEPVVTTMGSDWTGAYVGLEYGPGSTDLGDESTDTKAFGVYGGYNQDFGNFVLGGEIDYNDISNDAIDDNGNLTRIRAKAGYDMGRFMPYITLGGAHISQNTDMGDISETGWTYGIGADFQVTDQWLVGLDYSQQKFNDVADTDGLDLDSNMIQVRAAYKF